MPIIPGHVIRNPLLKYPEAGFQGIKGEAAIFQSKKLSKDFVETAQHFPSM